MTQLLSVTRSQSRSLFKRLQTRGWILFQESCESWDSCGMRVNFTIHHMTGTGKKKVNGSGRDRNHNNYRSVFICSSNMNKHYFLYSFFILNIMLVVHLFFFLCSPVCSGGWLPVGCSHLTSAWCACTVDWWKKKTQHRTGIILLGLGRDRIFLRERDGTGVKIHSRVTVYSKERDNTHQRRWQL